MIFTSVSRLGDFLLTWPVVSSYYKQTGEKVHFVLTNNFPLYKKIEKLTYLQSFTEKVSYVDVGTDAFKDWKFNPKDFNIEGNYINFGFYPDSQVDLYNSYLPEFYAKYNNLSVDYDFKINLNDTNLLIGDKDYTVWIDSSPWREEKNKLKSIIPDNSIELKSDFIDDAILAKHAKTVYSTMGGFMIIMDLCGVKCNVYGDTILDSKHMYYKTEHNYFKI